MHLVDLLEKKLSRLQLLKDLERAVRLKPWREQDRALLYVGVESLNLWTQFCKTYTIECSRGTRNLSGNTWRSATFPSREPDDIVFHVSVKHGHLDVRKLPANAPRRATFNQQPTWRQLDVVQKCCQTLSIGNEQPIRLALGLGATFLRELHHVRNFAAHKCEETRIKVDRVAAGRGIFSKSDLPSIMLAPGQGAPTTTAQWLGEMETAMSLMCG